MKKNFLDSINVKSPCIESWDEMKGNDEVRFCSHCEKNVHDISAMTRTKAEKLIKNSNGKLCVRYVKNPNGKLITAPPKLTQIKRRVAIAAGVLATSLTLSTLAYSQGEPITSKTDSKQTEKPEGKNLKTDNRISTISGTVTDANEAVVAGAKITLHDINSKIVRQTQTGENGFYQFTKVETNVYKLEIESPGFQKIVIENIVFSEGDKIEKSIVLEVEAMMGDVVIIENPIEQTEWQIEKLTPVKEAKSKKKKKKN
jgi:Carboxypeptidase regulatory-like domain